MSPARPTRWAVAGCGASLVEPLGRALRDSGLAAGVAVLADPAAWEEPGAPEHMASLLHADPMQAAALLAAGPEATYLAPAAAAGEHGADLLRALADAGSALLIEPPVPAPVRQLASAGSSPVLLATAHLWRWHPAAVSASDLVEARAVGQASSAEIHLAAPTEPGRLAGALDVLGLVLGGDDVASLQPSDEVLHDGPGFRRWQGRSRGGLEVIVAGPVPGVPPAGCTITVTGGKGRIDAVLAGADREAGQERGRLDLVADGRTEAIPFADIEPVRVLVDRFSRAALGAAPWGWSFTRDLRLQALAQAAGAAG